MAESLQQLLQRGISHHRAGRLAEAQAAYREVLRIAPEQPDALHLLGTLMGQSGRPESAAELLERAVALRPAAGYQLNLGLTLQTLGRHEAAITAFREMVRLRPQMAEAHGSLGLALLLAGQTAEAIASLRQAVRLNPALVAAQLDLGNALKAVGDWPGAIAAYQEATRIQPDLAEAHFNLGNAYQAAGRLDDAVRAYLVAARLKPGDAGIWNNLGGAYLALWRIELAGEAFQKAIACRGDYSEAYQNLAVALKELGKLEEAIAACRRAIAISPGYAEAHNTLGAILALQGAGDLALASIQEALRRRPDYAAAHSNLIFAMLHQPQFDTAALAAEESRWNTQHALPVARFVHHAKPATANKPRPLRVGYVSPDFSDHVVGRNLIPLFRHHDHAVVEVFAYADGVRHDHLTRDFQRFSDYWRDISALGDSGVAELIRRDDLDILVDLTLHTSRNRLLVFAQKPAPVQVSFAGYPGPTGLDAIDYHLTDPWLEPDEGKPDGAIRLPSFWCYEPRDEQPQVNALPMDLTGGQVTFGCLNNFWKVNEMVLRLWARVLGAVAGSRLMLLTDLGSHRERTLAFFAAEGVAESRIIFSARRSPAEYLRLYHQIDLGLDSLPYHGHTTSLDSFWMGVPMLTLVGRTIVGRAGLSIAMNLGLPELVTHTPEEFVSRAAALVQHAHSLRQMRGTLRQRMRRSVLMDAPAFARNVEAAFQRMIPATHV